MTLRLPLGPSAQNDPVKHEASASSATQERMWETLRWLLRYPLLRTSDLAGLLRLSPSAAAARLAQARAEGLARTLPASLLGRNVANLYALTPVGLQYLAERYGPVVWEHARRNQADVGGLMRLLSRLPGVLVTQAFTVALITHSQEYLCSVPSRQFTWSWARGTRLRAPHDRDCAQQPGSLSLRCDASVRVASVPALGGSPHTVADVAPMEDQDIWTFYRFVILWDSGLNRAPDMRRQLQKFLRIRGTYEELGQLAAFPALLVLAPDARRAHLCQTMTIRLATERWLTHPLRGGALALDEARCRASGVNIVDERPSIPFPPTVFDIVDPWQAGWRSFAQPQIRPLKDLLLASAGERFGRHRGIACEERTGQRAPRQAPARSARLDERVRLARLALRLDARLLRLLTLVYQHPLMSALDVAVALSLQAASAARMFRMARRLNLIETPAWSGVQRASLSRTGMLLLATCAHLPGGAWAALPGNDPPSVLRRYQREVRSLGRTPDHTAGVYGFFTALLQTCATERARGHDAALLWWETGSVCSRAFHEVAGWRVIRPDGAGECRVDGHCTQFWLEWDRGTMSQRDLRAKFAAYLEYARAGWWRFDNETSLPALLLVTVANRLDDMFAPLLRDMIAAGGPLTVWGTTSDLLRSVGPLGASWRRWQSATTGRHGRWGALTPVFMPADTSSAWVWRGSPNR